VMLAGEYGQRVGRAGNPGDETCGSMFGTSSAPSTEVAALGLPGGMGLVCPLEYMRLTPLRRHTSEANLRAAEGRGKVSLSKVDRAPLMLVSSDRLSVSSQKGYRTIRCTHGVTQGAWYCEVTLTHLGPSGHLRIGWATRRSEINAPVGFDSYGYGYRDLGGCRTHQARCSPYGKPFCEGDVIGMLIYLPKSGGNENSAEEPTHERVRWGKIPFAATPLEKNPQDLGVVPGSIIQFYCNGESQGAAFTDLIVGKYYPAVSLYTNITVQSSLAETRVNFGPSFKFPPQDERFQTAMPMSELAAARSHSQSFESIPRTFSGTRASSSDGSFTQ